MFSLLTDDDTKSISDYFDVIREELYSHKKTGSRQRNEYIYGNVYIKEKLGRGNYSRCYLLSNGLVLKTNHVNLDNNAEDGNPMWLEYCIKNKANCLPEIYYYDCDDTTNTFICVMEKLESIEETKAITDILYDLSEIAFLNTKYGGNDTISLDKYHIDANTPYQFFDVDVLNEFLYHLAKSNHSESGFINDMHIDNIMIRLSSNQLVLVDSFSC